LSNALNVGTTIYLMIVMMIVIEKN
jgi:hypothetical protein